MNEEAFDVVVIGAGHNGLECARILGDAGLSVAVVDAAGASGGMLRTDLSLGAEMVHHPHALFLSYREIMPAYPGLRRHGLRVAVPEVQHGIAFEDGRPGIALYRADQLERTYASIARYSRSDADLLTSILKGARELTGVIRASMFEPPSPQAFSRHFRAVEGVFGPLGLTKSLGQRSVAQLIQASFETPEVVTLLLMLAHELGGSILEPGGDAGFLGVVSWLIGNRVLPIGGMGVVAEKWQCLAEETGARMRLGSAVVSVRHRAGRATGVRLADGSVLESRAVISTIGRRTTRRLLGRKPSVDGRERATPFVARQHLVLRAAPRYRSLRGEPGLAEAAQVYFGWDDPAAVLDRSRDTLGGLLPAPGGALHMLTAFDRSLAPKGIHLAAIDSTLPGNLSSGEEAAIRASLGEAAAQRLADYAPGLRIERSYVASFGAGDRHVDLAMGAEQYTGGVEGLYLAGTGVHPGGGVHGACAHNAVRALLRSPDFSIIEK
ncbi:MAG: phytoene desaturase family protein [Leucobacter sp.]